MPTLRRLYKDQRAQAATEYILLLAFAVAIFLLIRRALRPLMSRLTTMLTNLVQNNFREGAFHRNPFTK